MGKASFEAHLRYILATDLAGFFLAALLVLIASRVPALISPLAVLLVILALAAAFALDVIRWVARGIRSVELDDQTLTLFRGRELRPQVLTRESVISVEIRRRFFRRVVLLRLSRLHVLRITEEAFPQEAFTRLLALLSGWGQRN